MEINKKLLDDIRSYCKLNGLKLGEYVNGTLKRAFMEDKYGDATFLKKDSQEFVMYGNKAFEDAVDAEVKRILNDPKEFEEAAKKFSQKFFKGTDELDTAMRKFNETFFRGMKEAQETEKEISDYMEKNNLEPVSMDEFIYGDDETATETASDASNGSTEIQSQQNVEKKDDISDKTGNRQPKRRTINVK